MKSFIYLLAVWMLLYTLPCSAQTLLRGRITEQHSGKPLSGIAVSALGADRSTSDTKGIFQLTFASKQPGEAVRLMTSDPSGSRLVVNQKEIDRLNIPSSPEELIRIVMADEAGLHEAQLRYYGIMMPSMRRAAKKELDSLNSQLKHTLDRGITNVLIEKISRLRTDSASLAGQVEKLSSYLARIDMDQASKLQKEAIGFIEKGQMNEALAVLDENILEQHYAAAEEKLTRANQEIKGVIEGYKLKAKLYESRFKYLESARCWESVVKIIEENKPVNKKELIEAYKNIETMLEYGGDFELAQEINQKLLDACMSESPPNDSLIAEIFMVDGYLAFKFRNFDQALEKTEKSRLGFESIYGKSHPRVANTFRQSAMILREKGEYQAAIEFASKALSIQKAYRDSTQYNLDYDLAIDMSDSYFTIATAYLHSRDLENSFIFQNKGHEIILKIYKFDHPNMARSYFSLGQVYFSKKEYLLAEEYFKKSVEIFEKTLHSNHPTLGSAYMLLSGAYLNLKKFEEAKFYAEKSLQIEEKTFGSNNPMLSINYTSIAEILTGLKEYAGADTYFEKAKKLIENSFGENHYYLLDMRMGIVEISLDIKDLTFARIQLDKCQEMWENTSSIPDETSIDYHCTWVRYYAQNSQPKQALAKLKLAVKLGLNDAEWLETHEDLASLREMPEFRKMVAKLKEK